MSGRADGSIIVDSELNSDGFKAGSEELKAAIKSLSSSVNSLQKQMQKVGEQKYASDEYKQLQDDIAQAEKYLDQYNQKRAKLSEKGKVNTPEWKALIADIKAASDELSRLKTLKAEMEQTGTAYISGTETQQYQSMNAALISSKQKLIELQAELARVNSKWAQMPTLTNYVRSTIQNVGSTVKSSFGTISTAISHPLQTADRILGFLLQKAGGLVRTLARSGVSGLVSGLKSAAAHMTKIVSQSRLLKRPFGSMSFILRRIAPSLLMTEGVFGLLRKAVNAFLQENEQLAAQLNSCWSSIGNLLGPIISRLINLVATAVSYFTSFLNLLGFVGKSTTNAISNAGNAAKKETDKLQGQLASFDELNVLQQDSGEGSSGGSSVAAPDITLPDWAKLLAENLKAGNWSGATTILTDQLNRMISRVNWRQAGQTLSSGAIRLLSSLNTAIITFDWQSLGNSVAAFIGGIDWSGLFTELSTGIGAALGGLSSFLWGLIEGAWNEVVNWWNDAAYEDGAFTMEGLLSGIWDEICNVGNWITENIFAPFMDGFTSAFDINSPSAVMQEQGGYIVDGLLLGLQDAWVGLGNWINTNARSIGSNICSGIRNGINSGWSWLKRTVQSLAGNLLSAAKSALGIHSPSTLFRDTIGLNIGYGIGEGIEASEGSIIGTVSSVADAVANEFDSNRYSFGNIGMDIDESVAQALDIFSDKISSSFAVLIDRMQAIANGASFTTPRVAQGYITPYAAQSSRATQASKENAATNNKQFADSISESVYAAVVAAMRQTESDKNYSINVYLDSKQITAAVEKRQHERGASVLGKQVYGY